MTVFANKREISAEKQGCQVIAAFPDTCFTPPENPATPPGVPIPYPNFGQDSDLKSGSGKVKIKDGAISQENSSYYGKCTGDEAGSAAKKGVITSKNTGKVYAQAWSSDVKVEGKGVARLGDLATTNHMSDTGDGGTMALIGKPGGIGFADEVDCLVGSYKQIRKKCNDRGGEAHHIIPDEYLRDGIRSDSEPIHPDLPSIDDACAVCVGGQAHSKAARERSSDTGKTIKDKADAYAERVNAEIAEANKGLPKAQQRPPIKSLADMRGHGYMHYIFDGTFGIEPRPVSDAVDIAKQTLANAAAYDLSIIDADCAKTAQECVEEQFKKASENPDLKLEPESVKRQGRFDNAAERLDTVPRAPTKNKNPPAPVRGQLQASKRVKLHSSIK